MLIIFGQSTQLFCYGSVKHEDAANISQNQSLAQLEVMLIEETPSRYGDTLLVFGITCMNNAEMSTIYIICMHACMHM